MQLGGQVMDRALCFENLVIYIPNGFYLTFCSRWNTRTSLIVVVLGLKEISKALK